MLRFSPRFGWMTMALGALVAACGSSDDVPPAEGTGGFPFGGFIGGGGAFGADGGATAFGGAGGASGGGTLGAGGGFGAGGFGAGGTSSGGTFGAGGSSAGGTSSGGAMTDGGVPDGSTSDGGASAGNGGASAGGSTSAGGTSSTGGGPGAGGASSADAGAAYCGNHIIDGTDKCDDGAVDTATCDSDCTKPKCGDGHLNTAAGEFCDDGGNKAGDGCDALCQLENTCPAPQAIVLTASAPGTVHGTVADDTTDATSHVNPAGCDGAPAGSGPDTLYSFTVDRTRNVSLSLTAGFDAILRTYTKACVPGAGLSEAGGDACSNVGVGNEAMSFSRLAAGTYFVVVDGAGAGDKGAYTLDVTGTCDGIDQLRIVELGIGATDYAVIRNMSDCPTFLGGATVAFEDGDPKQHPPVTTALPAITLAPGEQLRIQDNLGAAVPGAIDSGGNIPFEYDRGGTVLLCKSNCGTAADVVDALQFADGDPSKLEPPPALPAGLSYFPQLAGITGGNQNTKSWVRISSNGKAPNFGGDFCTGEPGAPFGLRIEEAFLGDPDFVSIKNHADCAVPVAPFQLRLTTDGVNPPLDVVFTGHSPIASGVTLFVSEPTNKPGDVNAGPIPNAGGVAGTVQLCLVGCGSPGTTVDAIAWDGVLVAGGTPTPFPALPAPITFTPGGLEGITDGNQSTLSYQRAAIIGQSSRFLASDWKTATKSR